LIASSIPCKYFYLCLPLMSILSAHTGFVALLATRWVFYTGFPFDPITALHLVDEHRESNTRTEEKYSSMFHEDHFWIKRNSPYPQSMRPGLAEYISDDRFRPWKRAPHICCRGWRLIIYTKAEVGFRSRISRESVRLVGYD
jgi:hypothetical protein